MAAQNKNTELEKNTLEQIQSENQILKNQLIELSKKLEESEKFKSNFFSNITNEIINPFTSIISISESILLSEKLDWLKTFSLIALIHNEALNLDLLLKNFIYAAKIEAGDIKIDDCKTNLIELLNNIKEKFKYLTDRKQINIQINFLNIKNNNKLYFNTDPEKLKIIITNLLYLAIEYSFENKTIEIETELKKKNLQIKFKDQGSGISSKYHQLVYEKFNGATNLRKIGAYHQGFNLIVSRSLLELMNGNIIMNKNNNSDIVFTINLPEQEGELTGISESGDEIIF